MPIKQRYCRAFAISRKTAKGRGGIEYEGGGGALCLRPNRKWSKFGTIVHLGSKTWKNENIFLGNQYLCANFVHRLIMPICFIFILPIFSKCKNKHFLQSKKAFLNLFFKFNSGSEPNEQLCKKASNIKINF